MEGRIGRDMVVAIFFGINYISTLVIFSGQSSVEADGLGSSPLKSTRRHMGIS